MFPVAGKEKRRATLVKEAKLQPTNSRILQRIDIAAVQDNRVTCWMRRREFVLQDLEKVMGLKSCTQYAHQASPFGVDANSFPANAFPKLAGLVGVMIALTISVPVHMHLGMNTLTPTTLRISACVNSYCVNCSCLEINNSGRLCCEP